MFIIIVDDRDFYNWFIVIIFFIIVFNNYIEEYWDGYMFKFIYV